MSNGAGGSVASRLRSVAGPTKVTVSLIRQLIWDRLYTTVVLMTIQIHPVILGDQLHGLVQVTAWDQHFRCDFWLVRISRPIRSLAHQHALRLTWRTGHHFLKCTLNLSLLAVVSKKYSRFSSIFELMDFSKPPPGMSEIHKYWYRFIYTVLLEKIGRLV